MIVGLWAKFYGYLIAIGSFVLLVAGAVFYGWRKGKVGVQAKVAEAQARGEKLSGLTVQISQKAGVDGKLFGSVTNADIVAALAALSFVVDKAQVRMPDGHIKTIGDHPISIGLHTDVVANITVSVLGEH